MFVPTRVSASPRRIKLVLATGAALAMMVFGSPVLWSLVGQAPTSGPAATVDLSTLPPQAQQTHDRIIAGGPFPYEKDGAVFGNRERLLPAQPRGYYREYTVKTPGSSDRGARRMVCGGVLSTAPEICFYSADHYASFTRIAQ